MVLHLPGFLHGHGHLPEIQTGPLGFRFEPERCVEPVHPVARMPLMRQKLNLVTARRPHVHQDELEKGRGNSLAPTRMSNNHRFDDRCRSARLGDVGEDHRRCCTDSVPVHLCQVDAQSGHFKHVRPPSDFDFRVPRWAPSIRITKSMDPEDRKKVTREGGTHRESRTSGSHITILTPCSPTVAETVG